MDNDPHAAGLARKAANKNDFQLKSREPRTTSLGKAASPVRRGDHSFAGGAENAIVSHLKQLCHKKCQREAGLKAEDGKIDV